MTSILLSIHPYYIDKILKGEKTVELRRKIGKKFITGTKLYIYATSPICAVVAACRIRDIENVPVSIGLDRAIQLASINKDKYESYFFCRDVAFFIHICDVEPLSQSIPLKKLRDLGITPPQSFCYVNNAQGVFGV